MMLKTFVSVNLAVIASALRRADTSEPLVEGGRDVLNTDAPAATGVVVPHAQPSAATTRLFEEGDALPQQESSDEEEPTTVLNAIIVGARGVGKTTIAKAWVDGAQKNADVQDPTQTLSTWTYPVEPEDSSEDEEGAEAEQGQLEGEAVAAPAAAESHEVKLYDISPYGETNIDTNNKKIMGLIQNARVAVLVFDITRPETLQDALTWKSDLEAHTREGIDFILLMNKIDQAQVLGSEHMVNTETGFGNYFTEEDLATVKHGEALMYNWATVLLSFGHRHGFSTNQDDGRRAANALPVSAFENWGMDESFEYMYAEALEHYTTYPPVQSGGAGPCQVSCSGLGRRFGCL